MWIPKKEKNAIKKEAWLQKGIDKYKSKVVCSFRVKVPFLIPGVNTITVLPTVVTKSRNPVTVLVTSPPLGLPSYPKACCVSSMTRKAPASADGLANDCETVKDAFKRGGAGESLCLTGDLSLSHAKQYNYVCLYNSM